MKKKKYKNKIYIITPCSRLENLFKLKNNINFDIIYRWIIVYDSSIIKCKKLFINNPNIIEFFHKDKKSKSGNSQRNFALEFLDKKKSKDFFIYFLDDDNLLHKNFYTLISSLKKSIKKRIITFDQLRYQKIFINNQFKFIKTLKGKKIKTGEIDIAMFLPNFSLINNIRWKKDEYVADGQYMMSCLNKNRDKHYYIPFICCYYNYVTRNFLYKLSCKLKDIINSKKKLISEIKKLNNT